MRRVWIAAAALIAFGVLADSRPEPRQNHSGAESKASTNDYAAPQNGQVVVNVNNPEASPPKTYDYQKEANQATVKAADAAATYTKLTLGLWFVAAFQAFLFLYQLRLMRRTLRDTQIALNISKLDSVYSNRASVSVKGFAARAGWNYEVDPPIINEWKVDIEIINTGKTHTKNMDADIWYKVTKEEYLPSDFDFPDSPDFEESGKGVVGPGMVHLIDGPKFPKRDWVRIETGELRLFIYGWIEYNDIFEGTDRHRTEFCLEMKVINDLSKNEPPPIWNANYREHNGMDDECMRKPKPYKGSQRRLS